MDYELMDDFMDEVDEGIDTITEELAGVDSMLDSIAEEMGVEFDEEECDCEDCEDEEE